MKLKLINPCNISLPISNNIAKRLKKEALKYQVNRRLVWSSYGIPLKVTASREQQAKEVCKKALKQTSPYEALSITIIAFN